MSATIKNLRNQRKYCYLNVKTDMHQLSQNNESYFSFITACDVHIQCTGEAVTPRRFRVIIGKRQTHLLLRRQAPLTTWCYCLFLYKGSRKQWLFKVHVIMIKYIVKTIRVYGFILAIEKGLCCTPG